MISVPNIHPTWDSNPDARNGLNWGEAGTELTLMVRAVNFVGMLCCTVLCGAPLDNSLKSLDQRFLKYVTVAVPMGRNLPLMMCVG